ncbi:MAG TPA: hopanoid-associated sugar epimerase [Casimicrobiaceae bacterium]|nr:hopanoid-associated sugar epimerase [Casimicrobiaceae bacterium]
MDERDIVLVTGATGFVGSAVARALLAHGHAVRVLVRPSSNRANLVGVDVAVVEGDIRNARVLESAMRNARYVVHAAADYRLWTRDAHALIENNVVGTRTVMESALAAGVERIVYTSSVATLALRPHGEPADETRRVAAQDAVGAYKRSKVLAEREVETLIAHDRLPAIIVHPSTPIGPRDIRPTPTGRIIVEAASGRMPAFVDTGLNLVHVDDVAQGHVAALQRGEIGARYILGGENVSLADMLREIARATGRRAPTIKLPRRLLYPAALVTEAMATLTGREPFLTRDGLRMARDPMYFTSARAERELGYRSRGYAEGVRDAIDWFSQMGYFR